MIVPDAGLLSSSDPVDGVSDQPDFVILANPIILMDPSLARLGSHKMLVGNEPTPELDRKYSNELHVHPDSPPVFQFATSNDPTETTSSPPEKPRALR